MLWLAFWAVVIAAGAGLVVKFVLDRRGSDAEITWVEYAVGMVIIAAVITPIVFTVGWSMAKANKLTFNEYWNGWELEATRQDVACTKDGSCLYEYSCEPYIVIRSSTSCDDDGCTTTFYPETEYHSCPYVTVETSYYVKTTLGDYTIAEYRFPDNPNGNRWTATSDFKPSIPQHIIDRAGVGIPPFWAAAKARIDAGRPGPVTKRMEYDNFLLASDKTILRQYSGEIDRYLEAGLLPPVQSKVHTWYLADKVYFVGYTPDDSEAWQDAAGYLNAALGTELQGDLHLVIVGAQAVDPDEYVLALKAYWQDPEVFGRDTLSKNGIIVVVGTRDGETVEWVRSITGMPLGNEPMIVAIRNVKGIPLTPAAVVGAVEGEFYTKVRDDGTTKLAVRGLHDGGALEKILWGLDDAAAKFVRISMTANDVEDVGLGFSYLYGEIEPTGGQKFGIFFVTFLGAVGVWWAAAAIGGHTWQSRRHRDHWR